MAAPLLNEIASSPTGNLHGTTLYGQRLALSATTYMRSMVTSA